MEERKSDNNSNIEQEQSPEDQPPQSYVAGFNSGYLMAGSEPELLSKIVKTTNPENTFFQGLTDGQQEWQKEQEREFARLRELGRDIEKEL